MLADQADGKIIDLYRSMAISSKIGTSCLSNLKHSIHLIKQILCWTNSMNSRIVRIETSDMWVLKLFISLHLSIKEKNYGNKVFCCLPITVKETRCFMLNKFKHLFHKGKFESYGLFKYGKKNYHDNCNFNLFFIIWWFYCLNTIHLYPSFTFTLFSIFSLIRFCVCFFIFPKI